MSNIAETSRTQTISISYALPMVLAINTFTLLALDQIGQVPSWIKTAVALFLSF